MEAIIDINLDATCSQCGAKGATQNGLCLKCVGKKLVEKIKQEKEVKTMEFMARDLRLATRAVEDNGRLVVITQIRMEAELTPEIIADLTRCQKQGLLLNVTIITPQLQFGDRV